MSSEIQLANELIDFIYSSPSTYHLVSNMKNILNENGFHELPLSDAWKIEAGKKYYATKNDSALFAFKVGTKNIAKTGVKMICAHSDSPGFKIKPQAEMLSDGKYLKLNTEVYGSPILMTWLDRPLSIAGRVSLKSNDILNPESRFLSVNRPLLIIPNLAIHLNRSVNDGIALNKQIDTLPLIGMVNDKLEKDNFLLQLIANELQVDIKDIIDFDLTLFEYEKGCVMGLNNEFISVGKLDDLSMAYTGMKALLESDNQNTTQMLCVFDNEEVGSGTKQGAGSPVLKNILDRISFALGNNKDEFYQMIYNSFMISADMAHAVHPNLAQKHDPILHPVLNGGPVIKTHANQKYTTDSDSCAVYEMVCEKADVPCQKFANRSDSVGGSTLGNVSTSQIDVRCVDMGNPMLAMHSIRELGGVNDLYYAKKSFTTFYDLK